MTDEIRELKLRYAVDGTLEIVVECANAVVITPCANCGHDRRVHWHYAGSGLHPGGHGKCLQRDCPCERYVKEPTEEEANRAA